MRDHRQNRHVEFQSTPLREGRRVDQSVLDIDAAGFNPRPSVRGDKASLRERTTNVEFQSTPLREGRQMRNALIAQCRPFQSTPLREGRLVLAAPDVARDRFNPRPSVRGDPIIKLVSPCVSVSIHAPP